VFVVLTKTLSRIYYKKASDAKKVVSRACELLKDQALCPGNLAKKTWGKAILRVRPFNTREKISGGCR